MAAKRDPILNDRPSVKRFAEPEDPDPDAPDPADLERGGWPAPAPATTEDEKAGQAGGEG